ncbi:MAG: hypothetical protein DRI77_10005 [Chloroflexi bacterium]|nr:MAG: hypothetical protein DRI77_10005 [Chloroflexota bacterium]
MEVVDKPDTSRRKKSLSLRAKVAAVSVLSFLVTTACAWLRLRSTPEPIITCYEMVAPTDPPTPVVMCYEPIIEIATPTPTTFISPISPLPTPTPTATPEAKRLLLDRLLTEGRFPYPIARQLES